MHDFRSRVKHARFASLNRDASPAIATRRRPSRHVAGDRDTSPAIAAPGSPSLA
jgi:hypothetical protein